MTYQFLMRLMEIKKASLLLKMLIQIGRWS